MFRDPAVGSIDPTLFKLHNNGHTELWLIYKSDGNAIQQPTPIWAQQLASDGLTLVGNRTQLLVNDLDWEGPLVEAPWMVFRNGYFYLFYSANMFNTDRYCVGVARSKDFLGPYEKFGRPTLMSNAAFAGPGHCSVVSIDDKEQTYVMVYHSWASGHIDGPNDVRMLLIDPIVWENDWPTISSASPSFSPQTIPKSF
jgi:arabinan endo-1,5-alpha-L-arabinosidase